MIRFKFKIMALAALIAMLCPLIAGGISDYGAPNLNLIHFAKQQTKNIRSYLNIRNNFLKIKIYGRDAEISGCYSCAAKPGFCFSLHLSIYTNNDLPAFKYAVWSRSAFV